MTCFLTAIEVVWTFWSFGFSFCASMMFIEIHCGCVPYLTLRVFCLFMFVSMRLM